MMAWPGSYLPLVICSIKLLGIRIWGNSNRATLRQLRPSLNAVINQVHDEIYELRGDQGKEFVQQLAEQMDTLTAGSEIKVQIDGQI
jgi:vacuolar-type H+-ATPase subunit E/Vma4